MLLLLPVWFIEIEVKERDCPALLHLPDSDP